MYKVPVIAQHNGIALHHYCCLEAVYNVAAGFVVFCDHGAAIYLSRMNNQRRHGVSWMSTSRRHILHHSI